MTDHVSFPCPICAGRLEVKDSRPAKFRGRDSIRRRRACRKCGHRLTTFEAIATGNEQQSDARLAAVMLTMRRVHEAAGTLISAFDAERRDADLEWARSVTNGETHP